MKALLRFFVMLYWLLRFSHLLQLALKEQHCRRAEFTHELPHYKEVRMMQQRLSRKIGQRAFSEKVKVRIKEALNAVER